MSKALFLDTFNNHILEFINDILVLYPNDTDIISSKRYLGTLTFVNKTYLIKTWYVSSNKFKDAIQDGNISFFLNRKYDDDINKAYNTDYSNYLIKRVKEIVKELESDNLQKAIKYIQNLTKLSCLYME